MVTDFGKIRGVVLSYPKDFKDSSSRQLCPFYDDLIALIPPDINVHLVINSKDHIAELSHKFWEKTIAFIVIPNFNEIWLRDILGFAQHNKVISPIFQPSYLRNIYPTNYVKVVNDQACKILNALDFNVEGIDLVWDGGNLIHNGKIGFITDKIFQDNPHKTIKEVKHSIEKQLNLTPIFIPTEMYDQLGHADGYLNFINENTITLSNYPPLPFLDELVNYRQRLKNIIHYQGLSIVDIWDRPVCELLKIGNEYLESARGIFNNFIQINGTLILPEFSLPKDATKNNYLDINKKALINHFNNINTIQCDHLAKLGGVLHCISWTY